MIVKRSLLFAALAAAVLVVGVLAFGQRLMSIQTLQSPLHSPLPISDAEARAITAQHAIPLNASGSVATTDMAVGQLNALLEPDPRTGGLWLESGTVHIAVVKTTDIVSFDARVQALRGIALENGPLAYPVEFVPATYSLNELRNVQKQLMDLTLNGKRITASSGVYPQKNKVTISVRDVVDEATVAAAIGVTNANPLPFIVEGNTPVTPIWRTQSDPNRLVTRVDTHDALDVLTLNYQGQTILFPRAPQPRTSAGSAQMQALIGARSLEIRQGCLVGVSPAPDGEYVQAYFWPHNVEPIIDQATGKLTLINEKGLIVARLGEPLTGGGGEVPSRPIAGFPNCLTQSGKFTVINPMYDPIPTPSPQ
jgi:hypothetical protein